MRLGSHFIWILSLVLISPSAPALAEVQRFRLIPDESQIVTKIKDPFGGIVNGALRVRQGEAHGDIDRLQEVGSVSLVIDNRQLQQQYRTEGSGRSRILLGSAAVPCDSV
jgi:hypothetical protein